MPWPPRARSPIGSRAAAPATSGRWGTEPRLFRGMSRAGRYGKQRGIPEGTCPHPATEHPNTRFPPRSASSVAAAPREEELAGRIQRSTHHGRADPARTPRPSSSLRRRSTARSSLSAPKGIYGPSRDRRIRGTSVDTPRCSRTRTIPARSVSAAIIFIRPPHPEQRSASIPHTRHSSRAQSMCARGVGRTSTAPTVLSASAPHGLATTTGGRGTTATLHSEFGASTPWSRTNGVRGGGATASRRAVGAGSSR